MLENNPTIEDVISVFQNSNFEDEQDLKAFNCLWFSQKGVLILTEKRISFASLNNKDEFEFKHIFYNLTSKVNLYITNEKNYLDVNYSDIKHRFNFPQKRDIIEIKTLLEKYIPHKLKIDALKGSTNIFLDLEEKNSNNKIVQIDKNSNPTFKEAFETIYNMAHSKLKNLKVPTFFKTNLKYILGVIFIYILVFYPGNVQGFYTQREYVKTKLAEASSYIFNFTYIQKCDRDMFLIGEELNKYVTNNSSYPPNISSFINQKFKGVLNSDPSRDPWGTPFVFKEDNDLFKLVSFGPDKIEGSTDDIIKTFNKIKPSN